ncbi:hypothetical protein ZWY2020_046462 [Hordeum vulgare]|nr:hypothetical protein ZWY2020_046462 [Hordeum vulgare]
MDGAPATQGRRRAGARRRRRTGGEEAGRRRRRGVGKEEKGKRGDEEGGIGSAYVMSSSGSPKVTEKKADKDQDDGEGGFFDKVKDFIQDIGEKIEEVVSFGKPLPGVLWNPHTSVGLEKVELIADVMITNPNLYPSLL